jgi:hypothetical protein
MTRAICAVTILLAFVGCAQSQQPVEDGKQPTCGYTERYRKEGWAIPGIKGAKKKWRVAVPNVQGVYMTKLEPATRAANIQSFRCSREHAGRLEIEDIEVGIIDLASFDAGGRIFAYNLIYGVSGIGAETFVRFYDLDGSGRFTLERGEINRFVPELIPDWVKSRAGSKPR